MSRLTIVLFSAILIETYSFIAVKQLSRSRFVWWGYIAVSVLCIGYFVYSFSKFDPYAGQNKQTLTFFSVLLLYLVTKLFFALPLVLEDVVRIFKGVYNYFFKKADNRMIPSRRIFISRIALGVAAIPFSSILYGIFEGKYNFKVIRKAIFFDNLPDSFDGLKILQISDIHSGSFDNKAKIEYAINLINEQDFDLLVFTGDLVNNFAFEMTPWIGVFRKIKTPKFGKFSILGNHDYGEYSIWESETEKQANFEGIKNLHREIDFKLLLNQSVYLENNSERIALVGVENWGHNFKKRGDLNKASENIKTEDFKILLSHDPSHFDYEVKKHPKRFDLTLSGHTHGLQFGVEVPNVFKWSPVQYIYKYWAGLYQEAGRFLYVNRGFGFHAYSGRVGIWPEITVLELKKIQKN